ncbi:MAG: hypothetical protein MJA32_11310 [Proteobacteria bacterium]|nr:hypothetical protein [Pseudomonadota bacterium]
MVEDLLQGVGGDDAAQLAAEVGEQVRVCQMEYPDRVVVSFRRGLNWRLPQ